MNREYINKPTEALVAQIRDLIDERADLKENEAVKKAFSRFEDVSTKEPDIVEFIRHKTAESTGSFTLDQIQLIMMSTLMRSSSSYGTIPELVVDLNLASDYEMAAKINDNAVHEAGTSTLRSHPLLLLDSFAALSDAINAKLSSENIDARIEPLNQASHALVRHIYALRTKMNDAHYADVEGIKSYLSKSQIHLPDYNDKDIETALHYCDICSSQIADYHADVLEHVLRMNDRLHPNNSNLSRDPTDKKWLAEQVFEFCTREASSADVDDKLSYVGAYGLFTKALLGHVPVAKRDDVVKWREVHSDEDIGDSLGWQTSAEQGHARDALLLATKVFNDINAENLASALNIATDMSESRLKHWHVVTEQLRQLESKPDAVRIQFNPADHQIKLVQHTEPVKTKIAIDSENHVILQSGENQISIGDATSETPSPIMQVLGI